jgi:hypothetical protein
MPGQQSNKLFITMVLPAQAATGCQTHGNPSKPKEYLRWHHWQSKSWSATKETHTWPSSTSQKEPNTLGSRLPRRYSACAAYCKFAACNITWGQMAACFRTTRVPHSCLNCMWILLPPDMTSSNVPFQLCSAAEPHINHSLFSCWLVVLGA